jgi:hypothetical protein
MRACLYRPALRAVIGVLFVCLLSHIPSPGGCESWANPFVKRRQESFFREVGPPLFERGHKFNSCNQLSSLRIACMYVVCMCVRAREHAPPIPSNKNLRLPQLVSPPSLLPSLSPSPTANNLCPNHHQHAPDSRASSPCCFTACTIIGTACSGEGAASGVACIGFRV